MFKLGRTIISPSYRSELRLQRDKPDNLFQPFGTTSFDRFPVFFDFVRNHLSEIAAPHLMSFGCSTGEEVFTLRSYFPRAEILGIDINPRSIAVCRKKRGKSHDPHISFKLAGTSDDEPENHFDAVFCMSVLRHGELGASHPDICTHAIKFEDFEKTVSSLCRRLKPGGYLVIRGSNFRFCDTDVAAGFDTVFSVNETIPRQDTPIYGSDNCRLANGIYNEVIFRKKETE